jgi:ribosomal protein S18 acetylase RimI-like enzyme
VRPEHRRSGIGQELLRHTEEGVLTRSGQRLYIDTSASEQYEAAQRFYRASGYRKVADLPGFFRDGDGKIIYVKVLAGLDEQLFGSAARSVAGLDSDVDISIAF